MGLVHLGFFILWHGWSFTTDTLGSKWFSWWGGELHRHLVALLPKQAQLGLFGGKQEKYMFMSYEEITNKFSSITERKNCSFFLTTGQIWSMVQFDLHQPLFSSSLQGLSLCLGPLNPCLASKWKALQREISSGQETLRVCHFLQRGFLWLLLEPLSCQPWFKLGCGFVPVPTTSCCNSFHTFHASSFLFRLSS